MVGGYIKADITESDEYGIGVKTDLDHVSKYEMLAAIGTLAADCIKFSEGELTVEMISAAVKDCYELDL